MCLLVCNDMDQHKNSLSGVGMTKFVKPRGKIDYTELGFEAGIKAMLDARITYDDVDQGIACYCYGDSTCGQRVFYQFGMRQIPIVNVNNNCSTGSTGLAMARQLLACGAADCILVVGFEKMMPGALASFFKDRENPLGTTAAMMARTRGYDDKAPGAAQMFGNAGREYMEKYGATPDDFAEIARVNHEHSQRNPYSQFSDVYTLDQIRQSPMVFAPLTKLQCCPTSDGGAAAVLVSKAFLDARPASLKSNAVEIAGMRLATDGPSLFSSSAISLMGYETSEVAARSALAEAGVEATDCQVCELHDCFSANEMITLDALGLSSAKGKAHELVRGGGITYPGGPGRTVGHPLGATGIAQCAELVWHLRGWATNRAVTGTPTRHALQHNLGLGGAAVVAVYRRRLTTLFPTERRPPEVGAPRDLTDAEIAAATGLGYNPAVEARGFTAEQAASVRSRDKSSDWALQDTLKKVQTRF
ncbi:nonspecific lipid-transfer protein [Magnaporthiopsis poae ATCC 64411]|uniref:Nonspecific lipid-transfer protein n=1 Tax=Magnaporthiopsis poae (strain ATCC 64411 / 73-15) TaxID=644358 RepID=A0A0C4DK03_MAGP6|nr:nonspecific lipid-transfer protein [Magnaporthiopsis poae ATCC 64411]